MEKLTYNVAEVAKLLGISLPMAYALVSQKGFPIVHVGRRKIIPREAFHRWLDDQAGGEREIS